MQGQGRIAIGVTGPDGDHGLSWPFIGASLFLAGARMIRITPSQPEPSMPIRGLIVSGGVDVDPERYGKARKSPYSYDFARDELEARWIAHAIQRKMPLLGICRGVQMINVCLGGSLHLDIRLVCETARYPDSAWSKVFARKPVVLKQHSLLYRLFRREAILVNSLHRQSLDRIGEGLMVTAQEQNRIIQAVEGTSHDHFILGTQWHPEYMIHSMSQRRIFRYFVKQARLHVNSVEQ